MYKHVVDHIKTFFPGKAFIPLHEPRFRGNEKKYLLDCIDSTFVSSVGRYVDEFEKQLAQYTGARYAVAAVNGTAALHISLLLAGVEKNDLVITQSLSFIATCNAISYTGASPLFVDVDPDTLGMSPASLGAYLEVFAVQKADGKTYHKSTGQRITACVPMHTFGHPCRVDELLEICNRYNIVLVEDAAESIGSSYKNRHTGTFGKLGAFSFNGNKIITSGGGGAIITDDEALAKRAKHLTTQAKLPHKWAFIHDEVGYNYRMPNINAALMCAQLEQLDGFLRSKRALADNYAAFFRNSGIVFVNEPAHAASNYWLCAILLPGEPEREAFLEYTNNNGVMTRPVWTLMHRLPMFENALRDNQQHAEIIAQRLVNIPSSAV